MRRFIILVAAALLTAAAACAAEIAVIDVDKILAQSVPGQKGQKHLQEVQKILQKGYDDLAAAWRGKESTPDGQKALSHAQLVLERQMQAERSAVLTALHTELAAAAEAWRKKNPGTLAVVGRQTVYAFAPQIDATSAVMREMNRRSPKFAPLPSVTVKKPAEAASPRRTRKN
jgi:Skp family chaperone for outer membrane proteins